MKKNVLMMALALLAGGLPLQAGTYHADLQPMINRMAALQCRQESSRLYQRRLLMLLPMIRDGADVNMTTYETKGNTALHYAVAIGSVSITRWLLEHGANPNAVTDKGATVLQCVGADNGVTIRNMLLEYGAGRGGSYAEPYYVAPQPPPVAYDNGLQPYISRIASMPVGGNNALYKKRLMMLLPMIQRGYHVDTTTPETKGNTALHYACGMGDVGLVAWLLDHGANPNAVTDKGATPKQCASNVQIVRLLNNYGAY